MFLFFTFGPMVAEEIKYQTRKAFDIEYGVNEKTEAKNEKISILVPSNKDFSIIIPKIGAVAPIVADIDPFSPNEYLPALKEGAAHAAGTSKPGELGNTYIFAHSTDAFYNVGTYNAVFYLLWKLEENDEIYIYYKGKQYVYEVSDKKIVTSADVKYLGDLGGKTLTLQTCYPPGTTLKRLIVIAEQIEDNN